ncbi:class I SAM-dependent methyltransferase [Candidatus Kaiserbacteria bacterium]|nr:class I SAM-dependent methyltransferase [Candidatus Kaiserbacteria bacterium]
MSEKLGGQNEQFGPAYFEVLKRDSHELHDRLQEEHALILRLMSPKKGDRILDIGCGKGRLEQLLTALEPSVDMVSSDVTDEARKYIRGSFVRCSMTSMPFEDDSFDKIFCLHVIAHFEDGISGIGEAFRILKPGGSLMILTPNKLYVWFSYLAARFKGRRFKYDNTARWLYSSRSLKKLLGTVPWASVQYSYFQESPRTLPFEWMRAKLIAVARK